MMVDGKKVITTEEKLIKNNMREKKVEVFTARGQVVRVPANMLKDVAKFDALPLKKTIKEAPKELKKIIEVPKEPVSVLPEMIQTEPQPDRVFEKPARKIPVRSKTK